MKDIKIAFRMTASYFEDAYDETVKYRLKYRKWDTLVTSIFVGVAFLLFLYSVTIGASRIGAITGASLLGYALYALRKSLTHKKKWIVDRLGQGLADQDTHIKFTEDQLEHSGPLSSGTITWPAIQRIEVTPRAIFLIPNKGISIFLPKNQFKNTEDWQEILKIAEEKHGLEVKSFPPS